MLFDSNRTKDKFGRLTVTNCILTGEDVANYYGYEVPDFKKHGLEPNKIYAVLRPKNEIKKADFSNTPLFSKHLDYSVEDFQNKFCIGTVGETEFIDNQTIGTIVFWTKAGIRDLEQGKRFLSCGYLYTAVIEKGTHNGAPYDIKMTEIYANHVALVNDPRYKAAIVADENSIRKETKMKFFWQNSKEVMDGRLTLDEALDAYKSILTNDKMSEDEKSEAMAKVKSKAKRVGNTVDDEDMDDESTMDKAAKDKMGKDKAAKDKMGKDKEMKDKDKDKEMKDKDKDSKDKDCMGAKDASIDIEVLIQKKAEELMTKFRQESLAMDSALGEYERVCGKPNRLAFDSAEKVLDTILSNNKKTFGNKTLAQKQAMVEVLPSVKNYERNNVTIDSNSVAKISIPAGFKSYLERRN
jgi:hypothetical protein